jgi:hypothetical protein
MTVEQKERDLQEIGANAYASICEMVAALECDYDRLSDLKQEKADLQSEADDDTNAARAEARVALAEWIQENGEELAELMAAASIDGTPCESREDAEQRIQEDPLSLEVRSGWTTPNEPLVPEEFDILLATGGPAVRIVGELNQGQPDRAWLEVQDWFTPWTQYFGASQDVLLTYAQQFYFGEG